MGERIVVTLNGIRTFADSDAPGTSLGSAYATGEGGEVLYSVSEYLVTHAPVLTPITSAGSGSIITTAERSSLHSHANKAVIDLITSAGSGIVISATERSTIGSNTSLATHSNRAILDGITSVGSGQIITSAERALIGAMSGSTNYRGGLAGNADLTGNATGNAYLDGGTDILNGDLFVVTSNGTLTTNTGTNIAVVIGDHVYCEADVTDSTIVDGDLDVVSVGASGVTSIDFGGGGGVQSGVIAIDSDNIGEGTVNLFLTADERADVATIDGLAITVGNNTTLGTHANRAVLDLITAAGSGIIISALERTTIGTNTTLATHANRFVLDNIIASGSGTIVSASERSALDIIRGTKSIGQVLKATGTGVLDFGWGTDESGGAGTVSSVNTVLPVAGNVTLTMANMTETPTAKILTATERTTIGTTQTTVGIHSTSLARIQSLGSPLIFSTALAISFSASKQQQVTLTGNTQPALSTGLVNGEEGTLVVTQDATGGRFIDWSNYTYTGEPDISQEAGAKTIYKIFRESSSIQHVRTVYTTGPPTDRLITWPGGSPVGTGLGGGASSIVTNVNGAVWTWPQVRRYQYYGLTCLGRASSIDYTQVQTVASNAPNTQCLSFLRPDLWQFWNRYGIDNPSLQWGTFLSGAKPTAAMGDQTRDGYAWATAQAQILAEYSLNSVVSSITDTGTLLTNPYEMEFFDPGGTAEFRVQSAIMDVSDENWLELFTNFVVAIRKEWPLVKGYLIQPTKMQFYRPTTRITTYQLHEWLQGTANTGWDLATNTGGADLDGWSINLTAYDDHEAAATMKVRYDALATLSQMLREKDPHAIQMFSPYYLGVDGHRNTTYRGEYRTAYIAENPGATNDDADDYLAGFLSQMANTCDVVQHYTDEDSADFSTDWSQQLRRAKGRFVKENIKPQNIAVLADM